MTLNEPSQSTLDYLLRQMRNKEDFPALSNTISEINKIASSETSSTHSLTKAILQDFSLTNKLIKLVNTASYGQFGGKINTISKAVAILGFDTIRNIAMTLILIEFMQNKSHAGQLKDEVVASIFAGLIARQLSMRIQGLNAEEAMICGIFHHLGKLLVTFYFFDEYEAIKVLVEQDMPEQKASMDVLGITYSDLGTGVARSWNFPNRLVSGMQNLDGRKIKPPVNELDQLNLAVNIADELTQMVSAVPEHERHQHLNGLLTRYEAAFKLDVKAVHQLLEQALDEIHTRSAALSLKTNHSELIKQAEHWVGKPGLEQIGTAGQTIEKQEAYAQMQEVFDAAMSEEILQSGIQDVTNTLVGDYKLNDILHMVLETMYRGMHFNCVLMLLRDNKNNEMKAGFGLGPDVDRLLPKFVFSTRFEPDVFHLAIEKGVDIVIEDIAADKIAAKIPAWYQAVSGAKSFLLLPVTVNNKTVACFYADMTSTFHMDQLARHLALLRTLRNQAVIAIKQLNSSAA